MDLSLFLRVIWSRKWIMACGLVLAGMLAFPEYGGNYNKIGWKWIGFDDRFSWAAPFGWYDRDV